MKKWRDTHKNEFKKIKKNWQSKNLDRQAIASQKYRDSNPDYKIYKMLWRKNNPDKVKPMDAKQNAQRRRELGYKLLNTFSVGCVGHHIDKENVIYIPETIHRSIRHSVIRNENMDVINAIALTYLDKQNGLLKEVV
jgi:hypothetical protein